MQEEMGEAKDWELQDAVGDSVNDWRQCCALMGQGLRVLRNPSLALKAALGSWDHVPASLAAFLTTSTHLLFDLLQVT